MRRLIAPVLLVLALTGCTVGAPDTIVPSAAPSASANPDSPLVVEVPAELTAPAAQAETERLADTMVGLVPAASVLNDDAYSQLGDDGTYWAVIHTVALEPTLAPAEVANALLDELIAAGWIVRDVTDEGGVAVTALSSDAQSERSWLVFLGSDASMEGQSVLSLQLTSPTLAG